MMDSSLTRTSRFLSLVLRHDPGRVGLALSAGGWVDVDDLIAAARRAGHAVDRELLERVVAENDKRRFALSADGARIQANQGHSVPVDLGLAPLVPPEVLYHGTSVRSVPSILERGIDAGLRVHVHLSADGRSGRTPARTTRRTPGRGWADAPGWPHVLPVRERRLARRVCPGALRGRSVGGVDRRSYPETAWDLVPT